MAYNKVAADGYCARCQFGYTSKVLENAGNYYQECNVEVSACNQETFGGLHFGQTTNELLNFDPQQYFTCHSCTDSKIPFIHLNGSSVEPFGVNLESPIPINSTNKDSQLVQCRDITKAGLAIKSTTNY